MRKPITTTILALAITLASANAAQAIEARDGTTGQLCPALSVNGSSVTGGCLVEDFLGNWNWETQTTFVDACTGSFDLRIGPNGAGYAVNQQLQCGGWNIIEACQDDTTTETIPWQAAGTSMPFCLENKNVGNPGPDNWAPVTWSHTFGANNRLLAITQVSSPQGVGSAYFQNTGATNEVFYTF